MTTEPTLREKVLDVMGLYGSDWGKMDADYIVNAIADLLSATGDPAYCRVADDLRGVVREEELGGEHPPIITRGHFGPARYLGQFDKRGEGK